MKSTRYYDDHAEALCSQYNAIAPEAVHRDWVARHLPEKPGFACDIGAGSGRDANWLAAKGWDVVAVEPSAEMRRVAMAASHPNVTWLDDSLPHLNKLRSLGHRFDLILLSAVWMHVPPTARERVFRILSEMLKPAGVLVISLRHGSDQAENAQREFHDVTADEVLEFAKRRAVALTDRFSAPDQSRSHVTWETLVFTMPDDGTGSLQLLRHIIVNDDKAATYKLGLIRALVRIAEGAPGMVLRRTEDYVFIPFGLVGLYWLKLYMPLVLQNQLKQAPSHNPYEQKGLGFAKHNHFYQLNRLSPFDLRVGANFNLQIAAIVIGAINDACANIQRMPATFITYPGQDSRVFECERKQVSAKKDLKFAHWQINKESLTQFGIFRVPLSLWQTLGQYACWVEPAILNEWVRLMMTYEGRYDRNVYDRALTWDEGKRDTSQVRKRIKVLQMQGEPLHCVWTNTLLQENRYAVDHCFPWSRWYNNDLWNLVPASVKANGNKREKLPSSPLMHDAKQRMIGWWDMAYIQGEYKEQFMIEAEAALPLVSKGCQDLDALFDAVLHQRARLKANQQLVEWEI